MSASIHMCMFIRSRRLSTIGVRDLYRKYVEILFSGFSGKSPQTNFILVFWAIRSSQNVEKTRTVILGLKFSHNLSYGIESSLPIMFFRPFLTLDLYGFIWIYMKNKANSGNSRTWLV